MCTRRCLALAACLALLFTGPARGEVTVTVDRNDPDAATADFKFERVPRPSTNDAATKATFTVVDGRADGNGGGPSALHDGRLPTDADQPASNFFFSPRNGAAGTGRLAIDLLAPIDVREVNSYSWHPDTRGPQVYKLYAADGAAPGFNPAPPRGTDPTTCGWRLLADVDTRPKDGPPGGQYGVSISDPAAGSLGKLRYLLLDCAPTETKDPFGCTFFSEIDVVDRSGPAPIPASSARAGARTFTAGEGKYQILVDTSETPDLTNWAENELAPVMIEWYPKIVKMLPSEGFEAPKKFSVTFHANMDGVANTAGTRVNCAAAWFRKNLKGEGKGAVVHELVHVVQQYWNRRRPAGTPRNPGWLTEGVPDYIRFYLYEPQTRGAEIGRRGLASARYDGSYRVTANFLAYVIKRYDADLIEHLNAAMRDGKYGDDVWKQHTGKTPDELGDEWKAALEAQLKPATAPAVKGT